MSTEADLRKSNESISGHTMYDIWRESQNDLGMKGKYGFNLCLIIEHLLKTQ
jgi:hypothetical protein